MTVTVTEPEDAQLVDAVRAGDESAFGTLFERYRDDLVRYVARMVPGGPDQAEDVIQDVFASALTSMRSSDRQIVFKPWIYRIAKNACIDRHRKHSRYTAVSLDTAELGTRDESKLSTPESTPDAAIDRREKIDSLRKAFSGLEDSHHEVLVLREFEGRSYDTIGNRMGLSPAAVQSTLFRARRRLQSEYDEIATGKRCEAVQATLDESAGRSGAVRKRRRVLIHMHDCVDCRRHAIGLGMHDLVAESAEPTHAARQGRGAAATAARASKDLPPARSPQCCWSAAATPSPDRASTCRTANASTRRSHRKAPRPGGTLPRHGGSAVRTQVRDSANGKQRGSNDRKRQSNDNSQVGDQTRRQRSNGRQLRLASTPSSGSSSSLKGSSSHGILGRRPDAFGARRPTSC